jgi:hypothetical protein
MPSLRCSAVRGGARSTVHDFADFLLGGALEEGVNYADREKTNGLVKAWRAGIAPRETESALRMTATAQGPPNPPRRMAASRTDA